MQAYANQLSEKTIALEDGRRLGVVYNITVDSQRGTLKSVLFQTTSKSIPEEDVPFNSVGGGIFSVPADKVTAIKDYVIVSQ